MSSNHPTRAEKEGSAGPEVVVENALPAMPIFLFSHLPSLFFPACSNNNGSTSRRDRPSLGLVLLRRFDGLYAVAELGLYALEDGEVAVEGAPGLFADRRGEDRGLVAMK